MDIDFATRKSAQLMMDLASAQDQRGAEHHQSLPLEVMRTVLGFVEPPYFSRTKKNKLHDWMSIRQVNWSFKKMARELHPQIDHTIVTRLASSLVVKATDSNKALVAPFYLNVATQIEIRVAQKEFLESRNKTFEKILSHCYGLTSLKVSVPEKLQLYAHSGRLHKDKMRAGKNVVKGLELTNMASLQSLSIEGSFPGVIEAASRLPNLRRLTVHLPEERRLIPDGIIFAELTHLTIGEDRGEVRSGQYFGKDMTRPNVGFFQNKFPCLMHVSLVSKSLSYIEIKNFLPLNNLETISFSNLRPIRLPAGHSWDFVPHDLKRAVDEGASFEIDLLTVTAEALVQALNEKGMRKLREFNFNAVDG